MNQALYVNNLNERIPIKILKRDLLETFSQYGNVLSVIAHKGIRKRGQAFIVFDEIESASKAHSEMQSCVLYKKKVNVSFARSLPNILLTPEEVESRRLESVKNKEDSNELNDRTNSTSADVQATNIIEEDSHDYGVPHNVLLVQEIPSEVTLEHLQTLLDDLPGFIDARMFSIKHVGFLEFGSIEEATNAIEYVTNQNIGKVSYAK